MRLKNTFTVEQDGVRGRIMVDLTGFDVPAGIQVWDPVSGDGVKCDKRIDIEASTLGLWFDAWLIGSDLLVVITDGRSSGVEGIIEGLVS